MTKPDLIKRDSVRNPEVDHTDARCANGWGAAVRTQGEIEAAICEGVTRFEQEYMGRGPRDIRALLIGDLLKQVRTQLVEAALPVLEAMVEEATGAKAVSLHHDISTATGEEVILFTLAEVPHFRDTKMK